jgi:hypothetical protein
MYVSKFASIIIIIVDGKIIYIFIIIIIIIIIIIEMAKAVHMANTPNIIGTAYAYAVSIAVKGLIFLTTLVWSQNIFFAYQSNIHAPLQRMGVYCLTFVCCQSVGFSISTIYHTNLIDKINSKNKRKFIAKNNMIVQIFRKNIQKSDIGHFAFLFFLVTILATSFLIDVFNIK